jgi:hypothetical protein
MRNGSPFRYRFWGQVNQTGWKVEAIVPMAELKYQTIGQPSCGND